MLVPNKILSWLFFSVHCPDEVPFQKLLFSATLSQNPEKLQHLHLVQPRLITAVVNSQKTSTPTDGGIYTLRTLILVHIILVVFCNPWCPI